MQDHSLRSFITLFVPVVLYYFSPDLLTLLSLIVNCIYV